MQESTRTPFPDHRREIGNIVHFLEDWNTIEWEIGYQENTYHHFKICLKHRIKTVKCQYPYTQG